MNRALLPLVAALLLLPVLASAQTPTPPPAPSASTTDLAVESVTLRGGTQPAWTQGTPTAQTVDALVRNHGTAQSAPYRIDFQWVADGETTWLNGAEGASFDLESDALPAGQTRTTPMPWALQPDQKGHGSLLVTLSTTGDPNQANNARQLALFIPVRDARVLADPQPQDIRPEETRFVRFQFDNRGNQPETFTLQPPVLASGAADRLEAALDTLQLDVPANATRNATLFVTYPFAGDTSAFTASYRVTATSPGLPTLTATTATITGRHDELPPPSAFTFTRTGTGTILGAPGDEATISFQLRNTGAASDVFLLELDAEPGWTATQPFDRIGLLPGEQTVFETRILFPDAAASGTHATIVFAARSHRGGPSTENPLELLVAGPSIQLSHPADWPGEIYLNDNATVPVRIQNTGDQPTPADATVTVVGTGLEDEAVVLTVPAPVVGPSESQEITVDLGNFGQGGTAQIETQWDAPGASVAAQGTALSVFVHDPDASLSAPQGLSGIPGEIVSYRTQDRMFRLTNNGNAEETYLVSATSIPGSATIATGFDSITLAPAQSLSIPVDHHLPDPAGANNQATLRVSAAIAGRSDHTWQATLTTGIVDNLPPVIATPLLPALWALDEPFTLGLLVTDNTQVFKVTATQTAPSGAVRTLNLAREEGDVWSANTTLTEHGNHTFSFQAIDRVGFQAVLPGPTIAVRRIAPPVLELEGPHEGATVRSNETYTVKVTDDLPLMQLTLTITDSFLQPLRFTELKLDKHGEARFRLEDLDEGRVGLRIEAINNAGARASITRTAVIEDVGPDPIVPQDADPTETQRPRGKAPGPQAAWALIVLALACGASRRGRKP